MDIKETKSRSKNGAKTRERDQKDSVENLNKTAKNDGHLQEERQSEGVTDELTNKKPDTKKTK